MSVGITMLKNAYRAQRLDRCDCISCKPETTEALRRDAERLKDAMRKAMAMLDKHEPEPAGAFAVLLLALNPELQSAKNAALRREET